MHDVTGALLHWQYSPRALPRTEMERCSMSSDPNPRPGDTVTVTHDDVTVRRTVHSVTYDDTNEVDGVNTTQGDWFPIESVTR